MDIFTKKESELALEAINQSIAYRLRFRKRRDEVADLRRIKLKIKEMTVCPNKQKSTNKPT
jgi:GTP cyclohydrolase FolE2